MEDMIEVELEVEVNLKNALKFASDDLFINISDLDAKQISTLGLALDSIFKNVQLSASAERTSEEWVKVNIIMEHRSGNEKLGKILSRERSNGIDSCVAFVNYDDKWHFVFSDVESFITEGFIEVPCGYYANLEKEEVKEETHSDLVDFVAELFGNGKCKKNPS